TYKSDAWAHSQFAVAEHKREELNALSPARQTRREYQDVIDSYRRVYYGCPTSSKADASVFAVAEMLTDMGRHFQEPKTLRSAIAQYEFLRREYPGSKYRFEALLDIGRIYADDLDSPDRAKNAFEDFLRRYPRNHFADGVRAALGNLPDSAGKSPAAKIKHTEVAEVSKPNFKTEPAPDPEESHQQVSMQTVVPEDSGNPAHITSIHHWSKAGYTRVAIALDHPASFQSQRIDNPDRIVFDLDAKLPRKLIGETVDVGDDLLKQIRVAQFKPERARIVLETGDHSDFSASVESHPARLSIILKDSRVQTDGLENKDVESSQNLSRPEKSQPREVIRSDMPVRRIVEADPNDTVASLNPVTPPLSETRKPALSASSKARAAINHRKVRQLDVREAQPTASGDRSLIRALGLKIGKIVIDPGHGGYDTGTIGPHHLEEKDLVLDVSRRLGKLLESRLGAQVVYTRKDDTFVPLETRTAIANREQADLFVSVHANSSHDPAARGVETYYLNFSSSPDALEVAARENAVSETSIHELQDLVKQIALKEKIEESREFASDVQEELHSGLSFRNPGLRDRGVKKAPFIVLIGANMPSILAEISFVSNPGDERRLETAAYRQRIAESLYRGISKYANGLSGVKVASKIEKTSGQ
ncbi:MAG: N-acetylmuramoyl-L-alanine amidase, partial [Terriglobales bacterium]